MTEAARKAAQIIKQKTGGCLPEFGIILGSGLGALAEQIEHRHVFPYQDLPGFPICHVEGHKGELSIGWLNKKPVVCLQGRGHLYEGCNTEQICTYVRTLKLLGCHSVIITGAVGSLWPEIRPGQLILLSNHLNFQGVNPLVGINDPEFGPRFPDMSEVYDKPFRRQMEKIGHDLSIPLAEGIYISVLGPSFETSAEIHAFRILGADVIGMSVVPEVIVARHCGLKVIGLTVVVNLAAGLTNVPLSHEETIFMAQQSSHKMIQLIKSFIASYHTISPLPSGRELG